ncbi:alpha/beta hydrolase [Bacillaceae bacterium S4-13-58]
MTIQEKSVITERLTMSYLEAGSAENPTLFLIHGNVSSNEFWDETIQTFAMDYHVVAPDLRGFGKTEMLPIDATRGVRDWSDDLKSFKDALGLSKKVHLIGWSLGGSVIMQFAIDYPSDVASLVFESPMSPFGFGGTKDVQGTPCYPNYAGSGGGAANPDFVKRLAEQDTSEDDANSPMMVMNQFYFKPPFRVEKNREDRFVKAMCSIGIGEGFYPGDLETCTEWPGVAPGGKGINNSISPKYVNLSVFAETDSSIPVLWIRGENDLIVSDQSFLDLGFLGKGGYVPGWPGDDVMPPQPMVSQMRFVLDQFKENGGQYEEVVMEDTGHSPHIEKADLFNEKLTAFLESVI